MHIRLRFAKACDKGGEIVKEDEKKEVNWEVADPKLPVVRSGHMENRREQERK